MKYLIVQDWSSTHGNHAGMVHMCDMLVEKFPDQYIKIEKPIPSQRKYRKGTIQRLLMKHYDNYLYKRNYYNEYLSICQPMFKKLKAADEVFLLEYNWPNTTQYELALYIRKNYPDVRIYALSHITPMLFSKYKGIDRRIIKWDKPIDRQLTLGSSLSEYLLKIGVPKQKISTGFHYVDNEYYDIKQRNMVNNNYFTIIAMGFLQRNYTLLANIVNSCNNVKWIICRGRKKEVDSLFKDNSNVSLKGFLEEDELRYQMSISDASLNVLEDTVGSNVITTSMSMGLSIIVSDVGSIHDYCDRTNAIFCRNNAQSFINEINKLSMDKRRVNKMKIKSQEKSRYLRINNINKWFSNLK